ncbi:MAG: hypothetical protein WA744_19895, partial [Candidatus Acidiferrales bacterium]
ALSLQSATANADVIQSEARTAYLTSTEETPAEASSLRELPIQVTLHTSPVTAFIRHVDGPA